MAGNRCEQCSKWVSLETGEPQEDSIEVSDNGTVAVEVTISRNCAECGTEMKTCNYTVEEDLDGDWVAAHTPSEEDPDHGDWEVSTSNMELTESGGGRYKKNMIGFTCTATATCKCGDETTVELSGEEAASSFDEV